MTTALPVMTEFYAAERWLPIARFEGLYEVSDYGRVRSVDRVVALNNHPKLKQRTMRGRLLFQKTNIKAGANYKSKQVSLWKENREYTMKVARLVAEAFLPNPGQKPFVLHLNDDATDNRLANLQWGDHAENVRQALERGRFPTGRDHHNFIHGRYAKKG